MAAIVSIAGLAPGVVVHVQGRAARITGSIRLTEDGETWSEHLLQGAGLGAQWLSVEDGDSPLVRLWTSRPDLTAAPGGRRLTLNGRRWARHEQGTADYRTRGRTPYGDSGQCEYLDYRSEDEFLSFERFGTLPWEISTGVTVPAHQVTAYREDDDAPQP